MRYIENISDFICKHAAVPERTLCDVFTGGLLIGLFLKCINFADIVFGLGNDISVFGTGVCRLHSEKI